MSTCGILCRIVSDIHSEFWPESKAKARKLADLRLQQTERTAETVLLLPGVTSSHKRRNVYCWVVERYVERFLAVYVHSRQPSWVRRHGLEHL